MNAQATSTPASTNQPAAKPTRRLCVITTVQNSVGEVRTDSHELTVPVGMTHNELLKFVLSECIPAHMRPSVVLHYSVHPAVIA